MHLTGKETTENPSERAAISLATIKTWTNYSRDIEVVSASAKDDADANPNPGTSELGNPTEILYKVNKKLDNRISLYCGDITMLQVDAIVNSTDATLSRSSGVAKAICKAAGPKLREKLCQFEEIESGRAVITKGYKLPAKFIIHTCAPSGKDTTERRALLLANCYKNSLKILTENKLKSIAFPCIATGVKGFCKEKAANIALKEIREFIDQINNSGQLKQVQRIVFCVLLEEDRLIYEKLMRIYFPANDNNANNNAQAKSAKTTKTTIQPPTIKTILTTKADTDTDTEAAIQLNEEEQEQDQTLNETKSETRDMETTERNSDQIEMLMKIVLRMETKLDSLSAEIAALKLNSPQN